MKMMDELILQELSRELMARFTDSIFSLTQAHVSKDLANAKIWVSATKDAEQLVNQFNAIAPDLRRTLSQKVVARRVPRLRFVVDETSAKAAHIENLLSLIK